MNRKTLLVGTGLVALLSLSGASAMALPISKVAEIKRVLTDVPAPEIAAKAAAAVAAADSSERDDTAIEVVRFIAANKVTVLPAVVGAISKVSPENSAAVAGEAASLSVEQAEAIARAASSAAPAHARKIAATVAKAAPKSAVQIARGVSSLVPESTIGVKEDVAVSVPSAQTGLQQDETLTRMSRSSETFVPGRRGIIRSFPGTIRGISQSDLKDPERISSGRITFGHDRDRDDYAAPR